ncbi:SpoIIE family protein phosphatase [Streptomyces chumphonensis]|uniref:SpoIIE family protein phosphatase n=1 Tax=Streptomyces chumphonensis TaxID=1214925 RepID=UPI003D74BF0C
MDGDSSFLSSPESAEPRENAYLVFDEEGVVTGWSPPVGPLLGYPATRLRTLRARDLVDDAVAARLLTRGDGETDPAPVPVRCADGARVELVLRPHRIRVGADAWQSLVELEDPELVRRRYFRDAVLRGLFARSPFIIDVFDDRLRFLAQNHSQIRPLGSASRVVGLTMREAAPGGHLDYDAFEERQRRVLETGEPLIAGEIRGRLPEEHDREVVYSETIAPLRDASGAVIALLHLVLDTTDRVHARERLALVNEASGKMGTTLDVTRTAREIAEAVVPGFADLAWVDLLDPGDGTEEARLTRRAAAGGAGVPGVSLPLPPLPLALGVLRDGGPLLLTGERLAAELASTGRAPGEGGPHSWLLVPMRARGESLGVVGFARSRWSPLFEPDDVLLAEELAARAGASVDNALRYSQERATALALQRSLLPQRFPDVMTLESASRYLPSSGQPMPGGAWFDVLRLSSARIGLVVGSAPGTGLASAVTMGRVRTAVRTLADLDLPPDELLSQLDDQVRRQQEELAEGASSATGTTCVYAVIDPVARSCTLATAGHPAPVLVPPGGAPGRVDVPSAPALGTGAPLFESRTLPLDEGDVLLLHTGPAPERTAPDAWVDAVGACLDEHGPSPEVGGDGGDGGDGSELPLDALCDGVLARLGPTELGTDLALLSVRAHPLPEDRHAAWELPVDPRSVGRARELTAAQLTAWSMEELVPTTELLVSELVTNAVRYGSPPLRLQLIWGRTLVCEVWDGSSTAPHVRRALDTDEGGRGLFMVAQLAELWGTRYGPRGKVIWAEEAL